MGRERTREGGPREPAVGYGQHTVLTRAPGRDQTIISCVVHGAHLILQKYDGYPLCTVGLGVPISLPALEGKVKVFKRRPWERGRGLRLRGKHHHGSAYHTQLFCGKLPLGMLQGELVRERHSGSRLGLLCSELESGVTHRFWRVS